MTASSDHRWTPRRVADRLSEAVDVLDRLPDGFDPGCRSTWPRVPGDRSGAPWAAAPSPEAIDGADEVYGWVSALEAEERRLLWWRAEGVPWKRITRRLGIGRTTAWQRWTVALLKITTRLNAAAEQNRPNNKVLNKDRVPVLQDH